MADERRTDGSANTAIVAIVVLILLAVVVFMFFFRNGGETEAPVEGPDVEFQIEPPEGEGAVPQNNP